VGYYQDQIQSIQQIFAKYDDEGVGKISLPKIPELLQELGRTKEVGEAVQNSLTMSTAASATFEEVVQALKQHEVQGYMPPDAGAPAPDSTITPLTLMQRLDEYRQKCEGMGEYTEAKRARMKFEELKRQEELRQKRLVEQAQLHEMNEVEQAQKQQFLEFSAAWDRYMADYESTAYMSLERLKEQHAQDFAEFQDRAAKTSPIFKGSRGLLALRAKQEALAKLHRYAEATQVKKEADDMEKWEMAKAASERDSRLQRKEAKLRGSQQKALSALLKRIQRDRAEQIRHRQADSQRLIQRNKNLKMDLGKKQHAEFQRAELAIRSILSQPHEAQKLLDENDPSYVARCAATGELPTWPAKGPKYQGSKLPKNYRPPGAVAGGRVPPRSAIDQAFTPR